MSRDYAAVPHEYREEMSELSDAEFGRLIRALLAYSETGEAIALCGNERFYAKRVMAEEDRHKKSYAELSALRSASGKAGAQARWQGKANDGKAWQTQESNTETKTKYNPLFSYEKKGSRARGAPEEDRNAWMREYD